MTKETKKPERENVTQYDHTCDAYTCCGCTGENYNRGLDAMDAYWRDRVKNSIKLLNLVRFLITSDKPYSSLEALDAAIKELTEDNNG